MELSRYSKIYPYPADEESVVLFSTKKTSAVLVPSGLIEDVNKSSLSEEEQETLSGLGLLVSDREQEKQEMRQFVREINQQNRTAIFTVILSLDCNLACRYCFEGRRKGKFYLSEETATRFIDFVKKRNYSNKDEIKITFYGGEPLLSVELIVRISREMQSFALNKGLQYGFFLVTNGTLLKPDVVKRLKPLGLRGAKVTLDGLKQIHDKFRPFQSGAGSFDVIVRNVKDVCDETEVQIGGNYTKDHYREFPRLLDYLADTGLTPDKIPMITFSPVVNDKYGLPDFHEGCESVHEPWLIEAAVWLREQILKRGYRTQKIVPTPCIIELEDSTFMNYDGSLYKCPGLIGRKEYCVGDIQNGLLDYSSSHSLEAWQNEECLDCGYLPICFGGCKYMKLLQDGTMRGVNCRKEYFDKALGTLVSQDIAYNL